MLSMVLLNGLQLLRHEQRTVPRDDVPQRQFPEKRQAVGVDECDFGEIEYEAGGRLPQRFRRHAPKLVDPLAAQVAFEPQHDKAVCFGLSNSHHPVEWGNEGAVADGRRVKPAYLWTFELLVFERAARLSPVSRRDISSFSA